MRGVPFSRTMWGTEEIQGIGMIMLLFSGGLVVIKQKKQRARWKVIGNILFFLFFLHIFFKIRICSSRQEKRERKV